MSLFKRNKIQKSAANSRESSSFLAETVLATIRDGIMITDQNGIVTFINPAAAIIIGLKAPGDAIGLDYNLIFKVESKDGQAFSDVENPLTRAMHSEEISERIVVCLVGLGGKRIPVTMSVFPVDKNERIITMRDITKELAEEGEQAEFISTASHEMRTPIASIEGYLSLSLNPQTATIDERARQYLTSAHTAARHLGRLFRDLLDVTKLDDGRLKPKLEPVEMTELVRQIADAHSVSAKESKLNYQFGSSKERGLSNTRRLDQLVYSYIDPDFLREIVDNLIDNAIKYTPSGGSIYINVLGDGNQVLINVTDTGIGISGEDITHIFQKFYRADNSETRTIGGTGLGLYLVKQRVEALGGRVWVESSFGEGSTFYVSLPRISSAEYEKLLLAKQNLEAMEMLKQARAQAANIPMPADITTPVQPATATQPTQLAQPTQPTQPATPVQPTQPTAPARPNQSTMATGFTGPTQSAKPMGQPIQPNILVQPQATSFQTPATLSTTSPPLQYPQRPQNPQTPISPIIPNNINGGKNE